MQRELGKEYQGDARIRFLKDNCDKPEEKGYMKRFSPERIAEMKEQLSETAIQINDIEEEKKAVMSDFKKQLEPLTEDKTKLLKALKNKAEHVREVCFKFVDTEAREVGYYNEDGDLIESRPAYAEEMNGTIFQVMRVDPTRLTGTHD